MPPPSSWFPEGTPAHDPRRGAAVVHRRQATVSGELDLAELQALAGEVAAVAGSSNAAYSLALKATVRVSGTAAGTTAIDTFTPRLAFQLTRRPSTSSATPPLASRPTASRQSRTETTAVATANALALGPIELPVGLARALALLLVAAAAVGYTLRARPRWRGGADEAETIALRHGERIVRVARLAPATRTADVAAFEQLVRLAEAYARVVLDLEHEDGHVYAVDDGDVSYRYRIGEGRPEESAVTPLHLRATASNHR